jgi:hypothetical protein
LEDRLGPPGLAESARHVKKIVAAPVPRIALTREEAALALGISLRHFERHVQPYIRVVRSGSVRVVPVTELEHWVERAATLAGA